MLIGFRSKARDFDTDARRLSSVRKSIEAAIADAEAELAGLQRRMKSDADDAGLLFGSAMDSQIQCDLASDAVLRQFEQRIMRGEQRVPELRAHIQRLRAIGESAAG